MVNVNISEDAWRRIRYYTEPGESFADTLDRVLKDYHYRGEVIGALDEGAAKIFKNHVLCPKGYAWMIGDCDFGGDCANCQQPDAPIKKKGSK